MVAWGVGGHVRQGVNASDNAKLTSSRLVQLLVRSSNKFNGASEVNPSSSLS